MKIISWNVNGIRANIKKGSFDWLLNQDADIFCLQETKAHPEQLDEFVRNPLGYTSYFDHSKMRKGYSGVAIYVKKNLIGNTDELFGNSVSKTLFGNFEKVEYGFGKAKYDQEGRFLAVLFEKAVIINCYFPNGNRGPDRLIYKLEFYDEFLKYIEKHRKVGKDIIFCGDVNTAHNEIDIARPKENEKNTGFLRIERDWIDKVIKRGYIDVFRYRNPNKVQYTWWDMKTFARERNIGWRLDYFFINEEFLPRVKDMKILEEVSGSDHCPIELIIK